MVGGPSKQGGFGHLRIPVLNTKQFVEILPADNVVELRNSQHVLDGHGVPIFFAERRYAIRYALFPIGILFVLQDVVHISEYLLGDVAWKKTEKQNKSVQRKYAFDAPTEPGFPRK